MPTSGVINLSDVALHTTDKVLEKFVKNLIRESPAMGTVPFTTKNVLSLVNKKWRTLPQGQKRNLNEGYSNIKGETRDETWEPRFYGFQLQLDVAFENLDNVIEPEASIQTKMAIAGMAATWTNDFINGDPAVDAKAMFGLKYLVANFQNSRQQIFLDTNSNNTGTALDVTASSANEHKLINALWRGLKYVGRGRGGKIVIYANENLSLGIGAALRAAGVLDVTKDVFSREFDSFAGAPIVDIGLQYDQTTEIITNTEGTGGASTSLYIVRYDATDGVIGVQKDNGHGVGPKVYDPLDGREMEAAPAHLLRCDWGCMLVPRSDYCIVRIGGIKNPASWTVTI